MVVDGLSSADVVVLHYKDDESKLFLKVRMDLILCLTESGQVLSWKYRSDGGRLGVHLILLYDLPKQTHVCQL